MVKDKLCFLFFIIFSVLLLLLTGCGALPTLSVPTSESILPFLIPTATVPAPETTPFVPTSPSPTLPPPSPSQTPLPPTTEPAIEPSDTITTTPTPAVISSLSSIEYENFYNIQLAQLIPSVQELENLLFEVMPEGYFDLFEVVPEGYFDYSLRPSELEAEWFTQLDLASIDLEALQVRASQIQPPEEYKKLHAQYKDSISCFCSCAEHLKEWSQLNEFSTWYNRDKTYYLWVAYGNLVTGIQNLGK